MLRRVGTQFVRLWYTIAMQIIDCDYFVVGSGMSGLMSALHLAPVGRTVLVTKQRLEDCNTNFAQGGICCVADPADSFEEHVRDTQIAGAGLCDEAVVRKIVSEAPAGIRDLIDCGVRFAKKEDGKWDLGREGGHSMRRIFHAGDITGQKCEAAMVRTVKRHPEIEVHENTIVIDLIITKRIGVKGPNRCIGAYVLDRETEEIYAIRSPNTILATGGCGKVYLYTCNPDVATGDGVALAWRAGAKVENMEFIQFHPTCLYHPQAKRFLISEAVRGEGAVLVDRHGQPFMQKYDARGSLAPRDIVARAIDSEMKRTGDPYCCLDIRRTAPSSKSASPTSSTSASSSASTCRRTSSRSCPPRTTAAAACRRQWTVAPPCRGSRQSARRPARDSTVQTASRPTRSLRRLSRRALPRNASPRIQRRA